MRSCDVCGKQAPDAKLIDKVLVDIIKASQLHAVAAAKVLEALKLKESIVNRKPSYGDICSGCESNFEKNVASAIDGGVKDISEQVVALANKTKVVSSEPQKNIEFFDKVSRDPVWRK